MIKVTLDMFSGRPNPTWILTPKEEQRLADLVTANPTAVIPGHTVVNWLGYRGLIVSIVGESKVAKAASFPSVFRVLQDPAMAQWLVHTSEKIDVDLDDYVRGVAVEQASQPNGQVIERAQSSEIGITGAGMCCASNLFYNASDIGWWNDSHKPYNNCYNFASNWRTDTFAQPGRASGQIFSSLTCSNIGAAVRRDGYADSCRSSSNISICLVIWPGADFHFYRLYTGTAWGHKPGQTDARLTDNSGVTITNPETCNRGPYTTFCEYFYANSYVPVN